jgi:hypothetical protein
MGRSAHLAGDVSRLVEGLLDGPVLRPVGKVRAAPGVCMAPCGGSATCLWSRTAATSLLGWRSREPGAMAARLSAALGRLAVAGPAMDWRLAPSGGPRPGPIVWRRAAPAYWLASPGAGLLKVFTGPWKAPAAAAAAAVACCAKHECLLNRDATCTQRVQIASSGASGAASFAPGARVGCLGRPTSRTAGFLVVVGACLARSAGASAPHSSIAPAPSLRGSNQRVSR